MLQARSFRDHFLLRIRCADTLGRRVERVEGLLKHNGCFSPAKIPTAMNSNVFSLEGFSHAWNKKAGVNEGLAGESA